MSFRDINEKAIPRIGIIAKSQFGKSTSIDIKLRDGTLVTIETRLEHMDTEIKFKVRYPDGTEESVNSEENI